MSTGCRDLIYIAKSELIHGCGTIDRRDSLRVEVHGSISSVKTPYIQARASLAMQPAGTSGRCTRRRFISTRQTDAEADNIRAVTDNRFKGGGVAFMLGTAHYCRMIPINTILGIRLETSCRSWMSKVARGCVCIAAVVSTNGRSIRGLVCFLKPWNHYLILSLNQSVQFYPCPPS